MAYCHNVYHEATDMMALLTYLAWPCPVEWCVVVAPLRWDNAKAAPATPAAWYM
jgi:hypothetical protein